MKKIVVSILVGFTLVSSAKAAKAAPSLEALLPAETVLVVAAPNYASAKKHFKDSASGQFWDSAEFKPFRKKLADGFEANVLAGIEEEFCCGGIYDDVFDFDLGVVFGDFFEDLAPADGGL